MAEPAVRRLGVSHHLRERWRSIRNRWWPALLARFVPTERLEAETLAVCIGVLNRSGLRLEGLLRSLRTQTVPARCVAITICDLGSSAVHLDDVRARCERHAARLVALHDPEPVWSRSRAINVAVRCSPAGAHYVFPTDVDMLFAPDFVRVVLATHLAMSDRAIVISDALDLPPEALLGEVDAASSFARLARMGHRRNCLGSGACQSVPRSWYENVRGYDERLVGWGYEDDDLLRRARRAGLIPVDIQHRTQMLHQWHETERERMTREGREREFEQRYWANVSLSHDDDRIIRNDQGWGELTPWAEVIEPPATPAAPTAALDLR